MFPIELFEENEAAIEVVENPLSSVKSQHIDKRWHFIRESVKTKATTVTHVESGWQRAGFLTNALSISLCKRHRKGLINLRDGE